MQETKISHHKVTTSGDVASRQVSSSHRVTPVTSGSDHFYLNGGKRLTHTEPSGGVSLQTQKQPFEKITPRHVLNKNNSALIYFVRSVAETNRKTLNLFEMFLLTDENEAQTLTRGVQVVSLPDVLQTWRRWRHPLLQVCVHFLKKKKNRTKN